MEKIDFISTYRKSLFKIVDGPYVDKFCNVSEIDYSTNTVVTKGGLRLPIEVIRVVLRSKSEITEGEALKIYRMYWGESQVVDLTERVARGVLIDDVLRILEGKDYVAGDFEEVHLVQRFCIDNSINIFNYKDWVTV